MDTGASFWEALAPPDAAALEARGVRRSFARGHAIFHAGQVADRVLILRTGRVKVIAPSASGREIVLAFHVPGELVGELAALDGGVRSASMVAVEAVEVLALAPEDFRAFLDDHPAAALALVRTLGRRLRDADARLMEFATVDTLGRVAIRLVELCERFGKSDGDQIDVALPLSQEELAGWACTSLESTARALQTMRSLGWLETRRRAIRVLDLKALRRAAG
ncbi:MAG TPA: Crp/Fnr family transcriptional regulator [Solirubrobacteraceae bacterium]